MQLLNMEVIKKDGKIEGFSEDKIIKAVSMSANRLRKKFSSDINDSIICLTVKDLRARGLIGRPIPVQEIHTSVENALAQIDKLVYLEYKNYRNYKKRENQDYQMILKESKNIIYEGDKENANKDSFIISTKRDLTASLVGKVLYLNNEIAPHLAEAHKNLDFYIHDVGDRYYNSINCCLFDYSKVIKGGFILNGEQIEEPTNPENAIEKALDLLNDIILVASSQQYGRQ